MTVKVNLGYNDTVCDNISNFTKIQKESQKLIAAVQVGFVTNFGKFGGCLKIVTWISRV